jgi:hypothetical protein
MNRPQLSDAIRRSRRWPRMSYHPHGVSGIMEKVGSVRLASLQSSGEEQYPRYKKFPRSPVVRQLLHLHLVERFSDPSEIGS